MKSLHQFDLNLLLILEALISESHVSRAAQRVYLSQSAMSHALNRLRNQLDDPILVRSGKGLQPTPRARKMLGQVRHIIELLEQTLAPQGPFIAASSQRKFTLACTDYFEMEYFPTLLQHVQKVAPHVVIELEVITNKTFSEDLENNRVDLVIGIDSEQVIPNHLLTHPWHSQSLACVAGINNENVTNQLTLEQYCALKHITFLDITGVSTNIIDRWLSQQQRSREHIARVVNYTAAARAIIVTDAIITLPLDMAQSFCQMFALKLITPPSHMPQITMNLMSHPIHNNDPAITWLIEQIKAV